MNGKLCWTLTGLLVLLGGCTNVLIRDSGATALPRLTTAQVSSAGLTGIKDNVYITFVGNCPSNASAVLPQCLPPISGAICRPAGGQIKFTPLPDSTVPNPSFAIEFETMPGFNPCQNNLGSLNPGVKNCNIVPASTWPGGGQANLIIKYTVKSSSGTCDLDPYLVLTR